MNQASRFLFPQMPGSDLTDSPEILTHLPDLDEAFDGKLTGRLFEDAMAGQDGLGIKILQCTPDKAMINPGPVCTMQYYLKVETAAGLQELVVNSRLYSSRQEASHYYETTLLPLVGQATNHPALANVPSPAGLLGPLPVTYAVFPLDGEIPVLLDVSRPERFLPVLQSTVAQVYPGTTVESFTQDLAHYGRYGRCVLRVHLQGTGAAASTGEAALLYGKIDNAGHAFQMIPVTEALQQAFKDQSMPGFRIPRVLAAIPEMHLILMTSLSGVVRIKELVRWLKAPADATPSRSEFTLESTLAASAAVAAAMHRSGITLGRERTLQAEVEKVRGELGLMQAWMPELGNLLSSFLSAVISLSEDAPALPLCFSHGDFRYAQLLFSGQEPGLVDFDTVCQAEPALDLGQFLAYQRLTLHKELPAEMYGDQADILSDLFLKAYLESARGGVSDEGRLRERVALYEIVSLVRMAAHSWQKLKGERLQSAVYVLQERVACLSFPS